MVRDYKKKIGRDGKRNYDEKYLTNALKAVKDGRMSIRKASVVFGVPFSTLRTWNEKGEKLLSYGRQAAISSEDEKLLEESLFVCGEWGFPMTSTDVRLIVQCYLNKKGVREPRFKDNYPGIEWFRGEKFGENIKRCRAAVTREVLEGYFGNLKESLEGVPPANIVNYDETNFSDDPGSKKVIVRRGIKHPERIIDSSKSSTSVMMAASGSGFVLPPYVVYKSKTYIHSGWTEGGPPGTQYNRSASGWFDGFLFASWFETILMPYFRKLQGPKCVIGDNLASHLSVSVIEACIKENVRFVLLPPNSTHLCQPLDVAYFRPLKIAWRRSLETWKRNNRGILPKPQFPIQLKITLGALKDSSERNILAGFESCGISPFNPDRVIGKLPGENAAGIVDKGSVWCESLIDYMKERRRQETEAIRKRKTAGKRLSIDAGKAVTEEDARKASEVLAAKKKKRGQKNNDMDKESDEEKEEESEVEEDEGAEIYPRVDDYVVVKFDCGKNKVRCFVGQVRELRSADELFVKFMRKKETYFVYPLVEEKKIVPRSDVLCVVNIKRVMRGRFYFRKFKNFDIVE